MTDRQYARRSLATPFGEISYLDHGDGPAAVFVHGVLLNAWLWAPTIAELGVARRCIAVDLMGHGETEVGPGQDLSFGSQAAMLAWALDDLGLDEVDLVGNDSGGAIAQILAARHPERIRSLLLTNCDTHDNVFPPAVMPLVDAVLAGRSLAMFEPMLRRPDRARAFLTIALEDPSAIADEVLLRFVEPLVRHEREGACVERWMRALSADELLAAEPALARSTFPASIVWGTDDAFFDVEWAYRLAELLPGATGVTEVPGARLYLPLERPRVVAAALDELWRRPAVVVG